ncbi:MAG: choice-of-anchor L domain-containing protein [Vicinamibacterales bacterium]
MPTFDTGHSSVSGPTAVQAATASQLVAAMEIPPANVVSATLTTSDPAGVGVGNTALGRFFPRQAGNFAILSSGFAASADAPNNSESTSAILSGLNTPAGQDMVQLRIVLAPPVGAQCLGFDFAFFSEEFPEYVGSPFNDVFLAELGGSNFQIVGTTITAPLNFAVDPSGNLISINSVFGVSANTQSTYDGATTALRAVAPLGASAFPTVELVLSIADLGDSIFDSAVFLDNFSFSTTGCGSGAGLADMIVSPQSGLITASEAFDFTLLASQPVSSFSVLVNGLDVSGAVAGCIRGTQPGGGSTIRCPGISGNLLAGLVGPAPYVFAVTANFLNGTSRTETVTYDLIGFDDLITAPLALLPPSGLFAATQRFDLVVVVRPDVDPGSVTITADGINVTPILLPCILANGIELVAGGAAFAGRCPLAGGIIAGALGAGPHVFRLSAAFSSGETASDTLILQVRPNTEP